MAVHGLAVVTKALAEVRQLGPLPQLPNHAVDPRILALKETSQKRGEVAAPRAAGFQRCRPRLAVVIDFDLRLVLVVQRAEAAQRAPGCGRVPEIRDSLARTPATVARRANRAVVAPAPLLEPCGRRPRPAALREPAPGAGDRAISGKECSGTSRSVASADDAARGASARLFCPARPFAAGRRPGDWPWGGICKNRGLGAADSQFSAPE